MVPRVVPRGSRACGEGKSMVPRVVPRGSRAFG